MVPLLNHAATDLDHAFKAREAWITKLIAPAKAIMAATKLPPAERDWQCENNPQPNGTPQYKATMNAAAKAINQSSFHLAVTILAASLR